MTSIQFTGRSTLLAAILVVTLIIAILVRSEPIALTCLTFLTWMGLIWARLQIILARKTPCFRQVQRTIKNSQSKKIPLNADGTYEVHLEAKTHWGMAGFRIFLQDLVPDSLQPVGETAILFDPSGQQVIRINYQFTPSVLGRSTFAGLSFVLGDKMGFFKVTKFIPHRQEVTVLPLLMRAQATSTHRKNSNLQILAGQHSHRSIGISHELLGIRDYQPGDPPRNIAWKPTARLGKLMTCEYENEVPIRATIIADLSAHQFSGRPLQAVADKIITVSAAFSKLLIADRDPVSMMVINNESVSRVPFGFGGRHLTRIVQTLISVSPTPKISRIGINGLVDAVFEIAQVRFPELLDPKVNFGATRLPVFRTWLRAAAKRRFQIAVLLSHLLDLKPGSAQRLKYDDQAMRDAWFAFSRKYEVNLHQSGPPSSESMRRAQLESNEVICKCLSEGYARAKDNELFIIVGRIPTTEKELSQLEDRIRLVRAANHRVIFVDAGTVDFVETIQDDLAKEILASSQKQSDRLVAYGAGKVLQSIGASFAQIEDPKLMEMVAKEVNLLASGRGPKTTRA